MPVRLHQPIRCSVFWALVITFFLIVQSAAQAAQVTLAWDPNDPAPDGYRVFQRVEGQSYDYLSPVWPQAGDDPTQATCTIANLADDTSYYFVVRANVGSDESGDSNEINFFTDPVEPTVYNITTNAGPNGSISPESATVNAGGTQTFTISPSVGFHIEDVLVDGVSAGVRSSYTFNEISADHVIEAIFVADQYSDTTDPGSGDTADPGNDNADSTVAQPAPNEAKIWFEAEDGNIDWPMIIADDPNASEGGYIHAPTGSVSFVTSPADSTGRCGYNFEVPSDGDYVIWGRVIANSSSSDSFHVAMDDDNYMAWHVARTPTDVWYWDVINNRDSSDLGDADNPVIYHLKAGFHKLTIATREAGTKIDRILVTNALTYIPSDMGEPTSDAAISKDDWRLVSVDSEELVGEDGAAVNAFDGNPDTIWHTQWKNTSPTHPHELVIDLGATYSLVGFSMLPRQDGSSNGRIIDYEFYVGNQDQWSDPVAKGSFADNANEKSVTFTLTAGRYIRLVALSASNGKPWTSVAEIGVRGMILVDDITKLPKTDWQLVSVDSEELVGEDGAAVNAFDGNPDTIWHTQWKNASPTHPHELVIDLGATYSLVGFSMLPRQDGSSNGRIINYALYVSTNPNQWSSPAASSNFANTSDEQSVSFEAATGRYIRLVALSAANNAPWTSVAEISMTGIKLMSWY